MAFHACVIVNPASAGGATGRHWPELRASLDRVLDRWDNRFTLGPQDATRIARAAVREGYEMIVCVGGDGTMNEVVTGLFEEDERGGIRPELIRPGMVLAPVRQGTGGDFARHLGLSGKIPDCVKHLSGDRTRPVDVGLIQYRAHSGVDERRAFLNIASFGISGLVDEKVNATSKVLGGRVSFLVGLSRALVAYRPRGVKLSVDGRSVYEGPIVTGVVANGQYFGGGMRIAPRAELDDGLLDIVSVLEVGAREVLSISELYSGKVADWSTVRYMQGRTFRAEPLRGEDRILIDVDGEQPGTLPISVDLVPGAVKLKIA